MNYELLKKKLKLCFLKLKMTNSNNQIHLKNGYFELINKIDNGNFSNIYIINFHEKNKKKKKYIAKEFIFIKDKIDLNLLNKCIDEPLHKSMPVSSSNIIKKIKKINNLKHKLKLKENEITKHHEFVNEVFWSNSVYNNNQDDLKNATIQDNKLSTQLDNLFVEIEQKQASLNNLYYRTRKKAILYQLNYLYYCNERKTYKYLNDFKLEQDDKIFPYLKDSVIVETKFKTNELKIYKGYLIIDHFSKCTDIKYDDLVKLNKLFVNKFKLFHFDLWTRNVLCNKNIKKVIDYTMSIPIKKPDEYTTKDKLIYKIILKSIYVNHNYVKQLIKKFNINDLQILNVTRIGDNLNNTSIDMRNTMNEVIQDILISNMQSKLKKNTSVKTFKWVEFLDIIGKKAYTLEDVTIVNNLLFDENNLKSNKEIRVILKNTKKEYKRLMEVVDKLLPTKYVPHGYDTL